MAKRSISAIVIIGVELVVAGVGLAFWGFQLSSSVTPQITEVVTGSETDKLMTLYVAGAVVFQLAFTS